MEETILIGRKKEQAILQKALLSREAEMVSVIGRRRVGKTYLIRTFYQNQIIFDFSGVKDSPTEEHLRNFYLKLKTLSPIINQFTDPPRDWLEAFHWLSLALDTIDLSQKKVVFLDEIPWLANNDPQFIRALSWFWNSWAVTKNLVVVLCGSAASWIIQKIVNDKGGLHNRITRRIFMKPFTLAETEAYFKSRHVTLDRYHIVQIYMAMGGIPHYLKEVEDGKSAIQNIDDICFSETGLLRTEFNILFSSIFDNAHHHTAIIRALAKTRQGIDRQSLVAAAKVPNGGTLTNILEELHISGFIDTTQPFGKKTKDKLYRLSDEYSLFYLQFIENQGIGERGLFMELSQTQAYKTWSGYAFEGICLKHVPQIKKAMSIGGVYSVAASFLKKGTDTEKGTQIDLLLDRNDKVISIFEMKFYTEIFSITKDYAENLQTKMRVLRDTTKTKKLLLLTLITPFGLKHNQHSLGLVNQTLTVDDLFLEVEL
jgi:uncharacterized protein